MGEGGEEGLAAFRGVGEAEAGGLGGAGGQGQVQVGLADVDTRAEHGLSPLGRLREVATRPCGPSMWMRSFTTGILCGGEAGAGGYPSTPRAWWPGDQSGRASLREQDTWATGGNGRAMCPRGNPGEEEVEGFKAALREAERGAEGVFSG